MQSGCDNDENENMHRFIFRMVKACTHIAQLNFCQNVVLFSVASRFPSNQLVFFFHFHSPFAVFFFFRAVHFGGKIVSFLSHPLSIRCDPVQICHRINRQRSSDLLMLPIGFISSVSLFFLARSFVCTPPVLTLALTLCCLVMYTHISILILIMK